MKVLLTISAILCSFLIGAQSRTELESERINLLSEMELTEGKIQQYRKDKISIISKINLLEKKVASRSKLIENIDQEVEIIRTDIVSNTVAKKETDIELGSEIEIYAELLRMQYRSKLLHNSWKSALCSTTISDYYAKRRSVKRYALYLKNKVTNIHDLITQQDDITLQIDNDEESKVNLEKLQVDENEILALEIDSLTQLATQMTAQERNLQKRLTAQKTVRERLNASIETAVIASMSKSVVTTQTQPVPQPISNIAINNSGIRSNDIHSNTIERKKGFIAMPVSGAIVGRYGEQPHDALPDLKITNNGIDIRPSSRMIKSIYDGEVVQVTTLEDNLKTVIISHTGNYFSVYSNLSNVSLAKGSYVNTQDIIGEIDSGVHNLHFELWENKTPMNPIHWLKKD